MLKSTPYYLKKSLLFFDLKSRRLPVIVFILLLAINSLYLIYTTDASTFSLNDAVAEINALTEGETLMGVYALAESDAFAGIYALALDFFVVTIIYVLVGEVFSYIYMIGAIKDIKGEKYNAAGCALYTFTRLFVFLAALIIKLLIIASGFFLLVVPGVILFCMLYFVEPLVMEQRASPIKAIKTSREATKGKRMQIFQIELSCMLIIYLLGSLATMMFSSFSEAVSLYVNAFFSAMMTLINTKRIAHVYTDMFYGGEKEAAAPEGTE